MANGVNIFDLAAKISVDASQSDKALTETQKKVLDLAKKFQETEKKVTDSNKKMGQSAHQHVQSLKAQEHQAQRTSKALKDDLQGAVTTLLPSAGALFGATGPFALGAIVMAGTAGAAAYLGKELFNLVERASVVPGKLHDISQKSAFSVETLSALANAAETSGTSLENLVPSLIIFQKNIEASREGNEGLRKAFRSLDIDIKDNETALRSAFKTLASMPDGYNKTAAAMRIFGRSGKDLLGVIQETNGDLDAAMERYAALGILIGSDAAKAADHFEQQYKDVEKQLQAVEREIAMQLMPTVLEFLQSTSEFLARNQGAWQAWGSLINDTVKAMIAPTSPLGGLLATLQLINAYLNANASAAAKISVGNQQFDLPPGVRPEDAYQMFAAGSGKDPESLRLQRLRRPGAMADLGLGGGGGGRGGGAARRDPGVDLLKQLQSELDRLTPKTKTQEIAEKLLNKEYSKTSDEVKRKIQILSMEIDMQKMILGVERERVVSMKTLREEMEAFAELVREAGAAGLPFFSRRRTMRDITSVDFFDLGGGSARNAGDGSTRPRRVADATRPRIATELEESLRRQYQEHVTRIHSLAADLTYTIDNALYDGFSQGAKRGFATLAEGLLDIIQRIFLARLEQGIADILLNLGNKGGGGGGGSWWQKLLGIATGAAAGGIGAGSGSVGGLGSSFAGSFASGGTIPMGQWGIVHEGEKAVSTPFGTQIIPSNEQSSGPNVYMTVVTPDAQSFMRRETQTQVKNRLRRELRAA